ncbi:MAG: MoaD/ThiS family protein [Candidatus Nanohalobium sp.]
MELEVEKGLTVEKLLEKEGVETQEVLAARNGNITSLKTSLEAGDTVEVLKAVAGG